jgi:hypothetical protein
MTRIQEHMSIKALLLLAISVVTATQTHAQDNTNVASNLNEPARVGFRLDVPNVDVVCSGCGSIESKFGIGGSVDLRVRRSARFLFTLEASMWRISVAPRSRLFGAFGVGAVFYPTRSEAFNVRANAGLGLYRFGSKASNVHGLGPSAEVSLGLLLARRKGFDLLLETGFSTAWIGGLKYHLTGTGTGMDPLANDTLSDGWKYRVVRAGVKVIIK